MSVIQTYVMVPVSWLEELSKLAKEAESKIESGTQPERNHIDAQLIGYAKSSEGLLKYNKRVTN